jgi:hypothetical protein
MPVFAFSCTKEDDKGIIAYWLPWNAQDTISNPTEISLSVRKLIFAESVMVDL